ncbi:MAG: hypothetical protein K0R57_2521 [Paenibacillaceae bacterium]|nr:hypothetical protein [Paenibacillaceae bacterium]
MPSLNLSQDDNEAKNRIPFEAFLSSIELPPDEVINASWERMRVRLEKERRFSTSLPKSRRRSALESLDDSAIICLYCEAVSSNVTEDFLEFLEDILLTRRLSG